MRLLRTLFSLTRADRLKQTDAGLGKATRSHTLIFFSSFFWRIHFFSRQEQNILSPAWATLPCSAHWMSWIWLCHKQVTTHTEALSARAAHLAPGEAQGVLLQGVTPGAGNSQGSSASAAHGETNEAGSVFGSERSTNLHQFSFAIQALLLVSLRL